MGTKRILLAIFIISVIGIAFSATLSYREFATQTTACSPVGRPGTVFGYPPCVYGLVMYALLGVLSAWGLAAKR